MNFKKYIYFYLLKGSTRERERVFYLLLYSQHTKASRQEFRLDLPHGKWGPITWASSATTQQVLEIKTGNRTVRTLIWNGGISSGSLMGCTTTPELFEDVYRFPKQIFIAKLTHLLIPFPTNFLTFPLILWRSLVQFQLTLQGSAGLSSKKQSRWANSDHLSSSFPDSDSFYFFLLSNCFIWIL